MSEPTEIPTPRTDAAVFAVDEAFVSFEGLASAPRNVVEPHFARELERELCAERQKLRTAREALASIKEQWWVNHKTNMFHGGTVMFTLAKNAYAATEDEV